MADSQLPQVAGVAARRPGARRWPHRVKCTLAGRSSENYALLSPSGVTTMPSPMRYRVECPGCHLSVVVIVGVAQTSAKMHARNCGSLHLLNRRFAVRCWACSRSERECLACEGAGVLPR